MNEKKIKKIKLSIVALENAIKALEEEKPEFEIGKWYKLDRLLINIVDVEKGQAYGFNLHGDWADLNKYKSWGFHGSTPATNEEVEAALIAEAKKRGFKKGVNFNGVTNKSIVHRGLVMPLVFDSENNELTDENDRGWTIYRDGQWAEIISEPKVVINGETMKQDGGVITFGCAKFYVSDFKELKEVVDNFNYHPQCGNLNRKIKSITLDSGVEITVEQLKLIVDNIK